MNQFDKDNAWQHGVVERLLTPVLRAHAHQGQVYFFGCNSQIARLLQTHAHVDAIIPLSNGGDLSLEVKLRRQRWPDVFLETMSCSVPGHERQGWMLTCQADWLLYCFHVAREDVLDCFPFYLPRLRKWFHAQGGSLRERRVPNPINGRNLWSVGKLAPLERIRNDLKLEGFRVARGGLVTDLLGEPIIRFLQAGAA